MVINIFEKTVNMASAVLSSSVYRLGTVWLRDEGVEVEEVRENDILKMNASYLTSPTKKTSRVYVEKQYYDNISNNY